MGWLYYDACYYKPNGDVDRKAEIDSGFCDGYTVLKSAMVGSTYYAAVRNLDGQVYAAVCLTSSDKRHGNNFGCKSMDESWGPSENKCPLSILGLLSPTDNEFSLAWRERCREYHKQKKSPLNFANMPVGTKVIWTIPNDYISIGKRGDKFILEKTKEYPRKKAYWLCRDHGWRIRSKHVDMKDVEIVA